MVSIGVAILPDDGESVESLIKCADTAMYQSKRDKKKIRYYNKRLQHKSLGVES